MLFENRFLTKNPDRIVPDLDAFDKSRETSFPKLYLTVCQARPHPFGESFKLGLIDRCDAFPAGLSALPRGKTGRPFSLQPFDPIEQQFIGRRLAFFDHAVQPLQRLFRLMKLALDFRYPVVGGLYLFFAPERQATQETSQSLGLKDPLDDVTRD